MRKRYLAMLLAFAMLFMNFISAAPAIAGATDMPLRDPELIQGFYFESHEEADGWTFIDSDGDGDNWACLVYLEDYFSLGGNYAYNGRGVMASRTMILNTAYEPDNWTISPAVSLPSGEASLSFYVRVLDRSVTDEQEAGEQFFAVYAGSSPDIENMTEIIPQTQVSRDYVQFSADLSDFAAGDVYVAFRHFDSFGKSAGISIDNVEIWATPDGEPAETPDPTNEPIETPAPTDNPSDPSFLVGFYFESHVEAAEWTMIDADGDGYNWENELFMVDYFNVLVGSYAYEGIGSMGAVAKTEDAVLTPDNWMISPAVTLAEGESSLSFYVRVRNNNLTPEENAGEHHFAVYAGNSPDIEAMTEIIPETAAGRAYEQITADLTDFSGGNVYIAFRYFDSFGRAGISIDCVEIWGAAGAGPDPTPSDPPVLTDLDLALNAEGGAIHFETGFTTFSGAEPAWYVVDDGTRVYAQAGNSYHLEEYGSSTSTLKATVTVTENSVLRFDFKACGFLMQNSVLNLGDHCSFTVKPENGSGFDFFDLGPDWQEYSCALSPGTYQLIWAFSKTMYLPGNISSEDLYAVDNVSLEPQIMAEEITATEELHIEVNHTGQLEWSVLPESAFDKEVSFTVCDPEIASIDDAGRVYGLSEGWTMIITTLVSDPSIVAFTEVYVTDTGDHSASFYGTVAYDGDGHQLEGKMITFGELSPDFAIVTAELSYLPQSAAYAYGRIYGFVDGTQFYSADFNDPDSPEYGERLLDKHILTLAFDYTRSMLYGLSHCIDGSMRLVSVDPESGIVFEVGPISGYSVAFTVDENGNGYYVSISGDLYSVDLDTAESVFIGSTGIEADYPQDMCYNFDNGYIYWAQFYNAGRNGLYRVNKETAEAEYLGKIGRAGVELTGMFTIPSNEPEPKTEVSGVSIVVSDKDLALELEETAELTAVIFPFTAENKAVIWTVDNEDVLAIDENGLIKGLDYGKATVTVTTVDGGFTASIEIRVVIRDFDFDSNGDISQWIFVDLDGDGNNWVWSAAAPSFPAHEGLFMIFSESFSDEMGVALTPDNWAISSPVEIPECQAVVSLYAMAADPDFPNERFAIYAGISPDPNEMECISKVFTVTGQYLRYEADLSRFAGETVYIAIRHFDCTDQFILCVDDVEVWQVGEELPEPPELPAMGDANGDGVVDFVDALLVLRHVLDIMELPEYLFPILDVDGDGSITVADALLILRYAMGLIPSL